VFNYLLGGCPPDFEKIGRGCPPDFAGIEWGFPPDFVNIKWGCPPDFGSLESNYTRSVLILVFSFDQENTVV
jgi:hypothetical protein